MTRTAAATSSTVAAALAWLERRGSKRNRDGMARFGIVAPKVFGVSVSDLRTYAKTPGRDHALALALWKSGWYEARMLAAFVDEPERVTPAQMDRWARDFDNWAVCDHACFHLFDKTPHAYAKAKAWAARDEEFVKRAASDDRNFVKKGVSWALRGIGHRSPRMRAEALKVAARLAASKEPRSRWVGKDAIRDLSRPPKKKAPAR